MLPEMDGITLCQQLRVFEPLRANLSIMPLDSEDKLPRLPFLKIIKQR